MKHRCVFVALSLALVSAVAAQPAAAADSCQYAVQDLPVPSGTKWALIMASSDDNNLILGSVHLEDGLRGVVWRDGELTPMDPPPAATGHVAVEDINNSGVVVGGLEIIGADGERTSRAFRHRDGQYELLPAEPGEGSTATEVNDAGDVVGEVWQGSVWRTAVWPVDGPRITLDGVEPIGISSDRKIVVKKRNSWPVTGSIIDLTSGAATPLPEVLPQLVVDNDRILHPGTGGVLVELDLDGRRVATYEDGSGVFGKNATGTIFGRAYTRTGVRQTIVWQHGVRQRVEAEKQPDGLYYGDVTDDGVLIGTYEDAEWVSHPARWFCR
jgi:uncharacterized membrane protein